MLKQCCLVISTNYFKQIFSFNLNKVLTNFKMLPLVLRITAGKSHVVRKNCLPSYQTLLLSSKFSTNGIKSSERHENPEKFDTSKLRTRLSLRRQKLPKFPAIDFVKDLNVDRFLPTNFKTVQHGDYEYQACLEDYVQVYSCGYQMPRPPNAPGGYAVYYGQNHPLNESGPVDRRQGLHHTKMFGFLRALKSIPQGAYSKVAFNVDDMGLGRFVTNSLPIMSENAFRSAFSGKLNKDLETNMEINTILRTRKDLTIRIQYTPSDIHFPPSHHARGMARDAANDAQRQQWIQTTRLHLDEEI